MLPAMADPRTDHALLRAARHDAGAFEALYRRRAGAVHAALARRVGADLAEDLTAETFARAWIARRRFRDERAGSALPWLLGIAGNLVRESARRRSLETAARERLRIAVDVPAPNFADEALARLDAAVRADALRAELTPGERDALCLRVGEDLAFADVGRALGIPPAAARLRVSRALRRLAQKEEAR